MPDIVLRTLLKYLCDCYDCNSHFVAEKIKTQRGCITHQRFTQPNVRVTQTRPKAVWFAYWPCFVLLLCAVLSLALIRFPNPCPGGLESLLKGRRAVRSRALEAGVWDPRWVPAHALVSCRLGSRPSSGFVHRVALDKLLHLANPLGSRL